MTDPLAHREDVRRRIRASLRAACGPEPAGVDASVAVLP